MFHKRSIVASLRDIAKELDVSISLVSKVLNDRLGTTGARTELVERIRQKAEELDYQKNHNALALLAGRQNAFAVFVHQHGERGSSLVGEFLRGIAHNAGELRLRMLLNYFETEEEFHLKFDELHRGIIDGLIISGVQHPALEEKLAAVQKSRFKVVSVYNDPTNRLIPNVGMRESELTSLATSHLLERGCRRIVHFAVFEGRTEGFLKAHRQRRIEPVPELIVEFSKNTAERFFSADQVGREISRLLDEGIKFDGICAQSDHQAVAVVNELIRRGVDVPGEVKVTGVDNSAISETGIVPVTSVSQEYRERGLLAVELLEKAVLEESPKSIVLDPQLVVRQSTGG